VSARTGAILKALAAFGALSLLTAYLLHLPGAARIDEDKDRPVVHADETLTLRGVQDQPVPDQSPAAKPGPVQLLAIKAAAGTSAAVNADMATLDDASRIGLTELGQQVPASPGSVQWNDQGGGGGAVITLTLAPSARPADIAVSRDDDPQSIGLTFIPHGAALMVAVVVPFTGPQGDTILRLGQAPPITQGGAGAVPLTFVIPDNQPVSIRLPMAGQADARFALGNAGDGRGRPLTMTGLAIGDDSGIRAAYCGAKPGAILWGTHDLTKVRCHSTLHASRLIIGDTLSLDLSGSAFHSENGSVPPSSVVAEITGNPAVSAFLGLCYAGIAGWLFASIFKSAKDAGPAPKRRPRKR
jgi:hypothetical protein